MPEAGTAPAPVALIFDYAAAWAWETQPQGADFDYFRLSSRLLPRAATRRPLGGRDRA